MGDYAKAEPLFNQALVIRKVALGEKHPDYATTLNNLALLYQAMGDYVKAEPLCKQALVIRKEALGEKHPDYATTLNNLALLYQAMGDYAKAEPFYKQALEIVKEAYGEKHPYYATTLNNLALLYQAMGDYAKAEPLFNQALIIRKEALGEKHPDYGGALNNLSLLYQDMGDYSKAEPFYKQVLEIVKEAYGEKHPYYATILNNLAILYKAMGDYSKAKPLLKQVLEIMKETLGEKHPDYAISLNNLASLYLKMGDYAKAEPLVKQAFEILKETLGEKHPEYENSLINLALLYWNMGDYVKAVPLFHQDFQLRQDLVASNFNFMSERQRNKYWSTQQGAFEILYPSFYYSYHNQKPSISAFAYNNELFLKGLLLNATTQVQNAILESEDEALINTYYELKSLRERIMFLQQQPIEKQFGLDSLELVAESLDKDLVLKSQDYRQNKEQYQVTWDKVRDKLKKNEVAIEFSSFLFYPNDSTCFNKIVALLVRKDSEYPKYIELADADTISALLDASPSFIYTFNGNGYKLYQSIWEPISKYLKEGDTVYFSASGILHQINLSAIPASDEKTVGDLYNLVQLSSTREIALQRSDKHNKSAVIYGGLFYDEDADAMALESRIYDGSDLIASRSLPDDSTRVGVKYLNGTKREAEAINELLLQNGWNTSFYTEAKGNEESFKALSGKKTGIMQIATHGFFFTNEKAQQKDLFRQQFQFIDDQQDNRPYIDPLLRSGLLFSGANIAYTGHRDQLPEGVQDGILTAKEISQLDLRGTDLVVLSACETGKGEITSEGVFGLQRAFKQAGVQTIVMSLWKVDDNATSLMMQTFYEQLLSGKTKREAFKLAQGTVRAKYTEPYYWAGFIMLD
jgi:CHAT domain-containing protein/Flp pilus assembly protein TadD